MSIDVVLNLMLLPFCGFLYYPPQPQERPFREPCQAPLRHFAKRKAFLRGLLSTGPLEIPSSLSIGIFSIGVMLLCTLRDALCSSLKGVSKFH